MSDSQAKPGFSYWCQAVGFRESVNGLFQGTVSDEHLPSVYKALTEYGLTQTSRSECLDVWETKDKKAVLLLTHGLTANSVIVSALKAYNHQFKEAVQKELGRLAKELFKKGV